MFDKAEPYTIFQTGDWRTPFLEFILEGALPTDRKKAYYLKKLAGFYFTKGSYFVKDIMVSR